MVLAGVAASALGASSAALATHSLNQQHVAQVDRQVPAGVELPVALDDDLRRALLELLQAGDRLGHLALAADDADQVVHHLLEVVVDRCRGSPGRRVAVERVTADLAAVSTSASLTVGRLARPNT